MTIWLLICNPVGCRALSRLNLWRLQQWQSLFFTREVPAGTLVEWLEVAAVLLPRPLAASLGPAGLATNSEAGLENQ